MIKTLITGLILSLFSVTAFAGDKFPDEREGSSFKWNKVQCSYSQALEIAQNAALDKFPEHKKAILSDKNPAFSERHGGGEPETIIREFLFKREYIDPPKTDKSQYSKLNEKGELFYYHGSYYREAIEVILSNECLVKDVQYQKGAFYYVF